MLSNHLISLAHDLPRNRWLALLLLVIVLGLALTPFLFPGTIKMMLLTDI